ncbi:hypothetical protein NL393_37030, partial [Klebsiella pneumoniae]|nr:hypothetical protein [Klebsiella pneumoniae]
RDLILQLSKSSIYSTKPPLGSSILNHKAPSSSETIISVLKGVAGEARSAAIGTAIGWIFGGK